MVARIAHAFLFSLFLAGLAAAACTDSDGANAAVRGSISYVFEGTPQTLYDSCLDSTQVFERTCVGDSDSVQIIDCKSLGQDYVCRAGVCLVPSPTPTASTPTPTPASSTSCTVTVSPSDVDPARDKYDPNLGRVTVFGSAQGSFSSATGVKVECNYGDALPQPEEFSTSARVTLSATELSYTAYCKYPITQQTTDYKLRVLVDGNACAITTVKVLGSESAGGTAAPSASVAPTAPPSRLPPALPSDDDFEEFTLKLYAGWNLVGLPFGEYDESDGFTSYCSGDEWYSLSGREYSQLRTIGIGAFSQNTGKSFWVYVPRECSMRFKGTLFSSQKLSLAKGWNMVSVQTKAFEQKLNLQSSCTIKSIYWYDASAGKYAKEQSLRHAVGYMVKVKDACEISAGGDESDNPPAPPRRDSSPTTIPAVSLPAQEPVYSTATPTPQPTESVSGGWRSPSVGEGYVSPGSGGFTAVSRITVVEKVIYGISEALNAIGRK